jgi:hypothetical protein
MMGLDGLTPAFGIGEMSVCLEICWRYTDVVGMIVREGKLYFEGVERGKERRRRRCALQGGWKSRWW